MLREWVWSSTIVCACVRLVISRLALIFVRPLDFYGRVRVVKTMFILCALHGVEASLLSNGGFPAWFRHAYFEYHAHGCGLSLLLDMVSQASRRDAFSP